MKNLVVATPTLLVITTIVICWAIGVVKFSWPNVLFVFHRVKGNFGIDTDSKIIFLPAIVFVLVTVILTLIPTLAIVFLNGIGGETSR